MEEQTENARILRCLHFQGIIRFNSFLCRSTRRYKAILCLSLVLYRCRFRQQKCNRIFLCGSSVVCNFTVGNLLWIFNKSCDAVCVHISMCISVSTECSLFLAVNLQVVRCTRPAPANINITELMFFSLQFPLQNHIMNLTYSPCVPHALPSPSNLIY